MISSGFLASIPTTTAYGPSTSRTIAPGMALNNGTVDLILGGSTVSRIYAFVRSEL